MATLLFDAGDTCARLRDRRRDHALSGWSSISFISGASDVLFEARQELFRAHGVNFHAAQGSLRAAISSIAHVAAWPDGDRHQPDGSAENG